MKLAELFTGLLRLAKPFATLCLAEVFSGAPPLSVSRFMLRALDPHVLIPQVPVAVAMPLPRSTILPPADFAGAMDVIVEIGKPLPIVRLDYLVKPFPHRHARSARRHSSSFPRLRPQAS